MSLLRAGHGKGRGRPHIEIVVDELPPPVPAPEAALTRPVRPPVRRLQGGQIADSESAKALGREGGLAKARKVRLIDSLGLSKIVEASEFAPYRAAADEFVAYHLVCLARQAGGEVGPAPSTMVASAALQLAASRWAFDKGAASGDALLLKLGSTLANDSRQNLLAGYQLAVLEAKARPPSGDAPPPWFIEREGKDEG